VFELLIAGGEVIDGAGQPRYRADVGLRGGRIEALGSLGRAATRNTLDASGRVVAPGFIDVHNHSDAWLLSQPNFAPKTAQGFTTEVLMSDGISYAPVDEHTAPHWLHYLRGLNGLEPEDYSNWRTLADYAALLAGRSAQNAALQIPYANLRSLACGWGAAPPDDYQMAEICRGVREGVEVGAVGLSTGLDYASECFATPDELVEACTAMREAGGGLYVSHIRYKKGIVPALAEAVEIGRRARVPVHISHLKAFTSEEADAVLEFVDRRAVNEVDFSFDVYPYTASSTLLHYLFPYEIWTGGLLAARERLRDPVMRSRLARSLAGEPLEGLFIAWLPEGENRCWLGRSLAEFVAASGASPADALSELLYAENMAVLLVFRLGDDRVVQPFLAHDRCMLGSDGIWFPDGPVHPRVYGSAPRMLGPAVRDWGLFPLEEAVHKMTGFPAERFKLAGCGRLARGAPADLVVLDPETVRDRATYEEPHQLPLGIEHVLVSGVAVVARGEPVYDLPAPRPGRFVRRGD